MGCGCGACPGRGRRRRGPRAPARAAGCYRTDRAEPVVSVPGGFRWRWALSRPVASPRSEDVLRRDAPRSVSERGRRQQGRCLRPRLGLPRDVVYTATHGHGLLISRDRGMRWTSHASGLHSRDLHALALDPERPRILYVWVNGYGLFTSEDAEDHWERLRGPEVLAGGESLALHPREPGRLYAGTANGVWGTEDDGRGWRIPAGELPHKNAGVASTPCRPD